jgi:hypothetical protein
VYYAAYQDSAHTYISHQDTSRMISSLTLQLSERERALPRCMHVPNLWLHHRYMEHGYLPRYDNDMKCTYDIIFGNFQAGSFKLITAVFFCCRDEWSITQRSDRRQAYLADLQNTGGLPALYSTFATGTIASTKRCHRDELPPPPKSWAKMLHHPHKEGFLAAARKEYTEVDERQTWKAVPRPPKTQVIPLMRLYFSVGARYFQFGV